MVQLSSPAQLDDDFALFTKKLKARTGLDLSMYKEGQMRRRLNTLRENLGFRSFSEFYHALAEKPELYDVLMDRITINVSEFFRNPNSWYVLEKKIIPDILKRNRNVKCWSAACAMGEEPYSMVMLLSSFLKRYEFQVLATDIDQKALEKAKMGVYSRQAVKEVPPHFLKKHFTIQGEQYVISEEIKKCVRFQRHNLLADPFEKNFDLIVCRNVLIYFTEEAKDLLLMKFSRSLKPGGYLFVGGTEQIFDPEKYQLEMVEMFFYRRKVQGK